MPRAGASAPARGGALDTKGAMTELLRAQCLRRLRYWGTCESGAPSGSQLVPWAAARRSQVVQSTNSKQQVRRPDFPVFELFNAAWCVRTPQPRGTQPRLRCSVVGLLRAPPAPRLRFCRGSASCAFPALSPTRFGLLVATKPRTSGGLAALRVPVGEGIAGAKTGVCF